MYKDNIITKLNYGSDYKEVRIPVKNFNGFYSIKDVSPLINIQEKIKEILLNPINSKPLKDLVVGCKNVLIVCDDNTRITPVKLFLPHIVKNLNSAGITDSNIKILFATGSHRPMNEEEIKTKIGGEVFTKIKTFNHDCKKNLVYKGITSLGTHIYINGLIDEVDLIIGIGNIIPHRYCGWAGGGKIIQPGVCGIETIAGTHLLVTKDKNIKLGSVDNIVRKEINEVASTAGLKFIINTILNNTGEIIDIVAGEVERTHLEGIKIARKIMGIPIPKTDVVIISSFPEDNNLWQALKALYTADIVVNEGGTIILVTPVHEGVGEHQEFIKLLGLAKEKILYMIKNNLVKDLLSGAAAYAEKLVIEKTDIILVTEGISDEIVNFMGVKKSSNLQTVVDTILEEKPTAKISCLNEGPVILPILEE